MDCTEIITITASKFLNARLTGAIAAAQWNRPDWASNVKELAFHFIYETDYFSVIAQTKDRVIGRLNCIQNNAEPKLWYYGDLFVIPEYRRRHIAESMLNAAIEILADKGCKILRCYVEPNNAPSLSFQRKFGFIEKPFNNFNDLINDGRTMLETELAVYRTEIATIDDARYIAQIYRKNMDALHGSHITYDEWKAMLSANDPDEMNFLIYKGAIPVAWLKINGLADIETAWLSMLAVVPELHRLGIGEYAVNFAEDYCRKANVKRLYIRTTEDNIPAQGLYAKCGFKVLERIKYTTGDNIERDGLTFVKTLI